MSRFILALVLGVILPVAATWAGNSPAVAEELDAEESYVGDAGTHGKGTATSIDENCADVKFVVSPQLSKNFLLRIGGEWQRFSFGVAATAPVPRVLQQVSAVIGGDYQLGDRWLVRAEVQPGVYGDFEGITGRDVDAPLVLGGAYLADADLQWFLGLRVDVRSEYPVLPAAGVRWKFSDQWTLDFQLPKPRLEYDLTDRWQLYLGGDIEAGTFRIGDHFGSDHGQPKFNGAMVDYLELRVGPGLSWKITPILTLEAEAGLMPYRDFDFFHAGADLRSHNAPYGQLVCHGRF